MTPRPICWDTSKPSGQTRPGNIWLWNNQNVFLTPWPTHRPHAAISQCKHKDWLRRQNTPLLRACKWISALSLDMLNYIKLAAVQWSLCVCKPLCLPYAYWMRWIRLFCRTDLFMVSGISSMNCLLSFIWHLCNSWNEEEEVWVLLQNQLRLISSHYLELTSLYGLSEPDKSDKTTFKSLLLSLLLSWINPWFLSL